MAGSAGRDDRYESEVNVLGISLDEFVYGQGNPPPQVVKMDIEGGEVLALPGMRRVLTEARPLMLMELHGPEFLPGCLGSANHSRVTKYPGCVPATQLFIRWKNWGGRHISWRNQCTRWEAGYHDPLSRETCIQRRVLTPYRAVFFDALAGACDGGLDVFAGAHAGGNQSPLPPIGSCSLHPGAQPPHPSADPCTCAINAAF